ncbi:MAG: ATP-binding cassette domain-containing protein, partial [Planctomycetes bacterium]|nr:ATP-binding cassette domain-containing protein [Planctomycetota bacterium]
MTSDVGEERVACPYCLTLLPASVERCGRCRQPVDWVRELPEFQRALAVAERIPERPWRLRVEARWLGGETELTCAGPGALELAAPNGCTMRLSISSPDGPLQLAGDDGVQAVELPGECEWSGMRLRVWLEAVARSRRTEERIDAPLGEEIRLSDSLAGVSIGKGIEPGDRHIQVSQTRLEGRHCRIIRQPHCNPAVHWIVDLGSASGTYVNRQEILVHRLRSGDLVQLAGCAWLYSASDGMLIPVAGIEGVRLQAREVDRLGKLGGASFDIDRGELVAICGRSGAGKSTLLEALVGGQGSRDCGAIYADGRDIDAADDWYRSVLGYVSQRPFVHEDLTARQAVQLSARFRGGEVNLRKVDDVLRQIDLGRDRWSAAPKELSGGEANRVRTATEIIGQPRLFFLDEPTSGLDPDAEVQLLSFLRSLSLRGCTVVAVIHSLHRLPLFDRVLVVGKGGLVFDGTPEKLRRGIPGGRFLDLDYDQLEAPSPPPLSEVPAKSRVADPAKPRTSWADQLGTLLQREITLIRNRPWKRLGLPVGLTPVVFAGANAVVPSDQLALLGFLCVVSVIWLSASLSAQSIASEREVYDHEQRLFLRPSAYVAAKTVTLYSLAVAQAAVFYVLVYGLRRLLGFQALYGALWPMAYLLPVACAAAGMGLVLSACVGRNRLAAGFVLPLLMMVQIVFSVHVAGEGKAMLHSAYPSSILARDVGGAEGAAAQDDATDAREFVMTGSFLTISRWG